VAEQPGLGLRNHRGGGDNQCYGQNRLKQFHQTTLFSTELVVQSAPTQRVKTFHS
jgi:hypothetical protein